MKKEAGTGSAESVGDDLVVRRLNPILKVSEEVLSVSCHPELLGQLLRPRYTPSMRTRLSLAPHDANTTAYLTVTGCWGPLKVCVGGGHTMFPAWKLRRITLIRSVAAHCYLTGGAVRIQFLHRRRQASRLRPDRHLAPLILPGERRVRDWNLP